MAHATPTSPPAGSGRWRFKIPVLVSDLDLECQLWLKLRLAPMCPWIGSISLAFLGAPNVKVQLSPYNRVRLMRIPLVQVGGARDVAACMAMVGHGACVQGVVWWPCGMQCCGQGLCGCLCGVSVQCWWPYMLRAVITSSCGLYCGHSC